MTNWQIPGYSHNQDISSNITSSPFNVMSLSLKASLTA